MARKYLVGIDVGSSFVKVCFTDSDTGLPVAEASTPSVEMKIDAPREGWAEQDPETWWKNVVNGIQVCISKLPRENWDTAAVGISYQMHGLVPLGKDHRPVRPAIIWCDSRAVEVGEGSFQKLGSAWCMQHLLNSPGNFTASKLGWMKREEPAEFGRVEKALLPGDYIALKLTGEVNTTPSGLSEGIFWDFKSRKASPELLESMGLSENHLPPTVPTFAIHGKVTEQAAHETGLKKGAPVSYRAGDQVNNAFSLSVLNPGEVAATAGTSGVVYAVTDQPIFDEKSRVNIFLHANDSAERNRNGVLLCVNGAGIVNTWWRRLFSGVGPIPDYQKMNELAATASIGSLGLKTFPFGNGSERIFENRRLGASMVDLDLNRHGAPEVLRSVQEGVAFAMAYGFELLQQLGFKASVTRAPMGNLFQSQVFREAFVHSSGTDLMLYETSGARGASLAAGLGAGIYKSTKEALGSLRQVAPVEKEKDKTEQYGVAYRDWKRTLTSRT